MKSFAPSLAFIMRFTATRKWSVRDHNAVRYRPSMIVRVIKHTVFRYLIGSFFTETIVRHRVSYSRNQF